MKRQGLGRVHHHLSAARPLHITDPLSPAFNPSVGDTPGELFKYMMVCQHKAYGETILKHQPNQPMHLRHLKDLLKTVDPLTIKRAILYASLRCQGPYGIRMIKLYVEEIRNGLC